MTNRVEKEFSKIHTVQGFRLLKLKITNALKNRLKNEFTPVPKVTSRERIAVELRLISASIPYKILGNVAHLIVICL